MKYTIRIKSNRHVEVIDEKDHLLGSMDYSAWDTETGKIHAESGNDYKIVADSAFGFDRSLREGRVVLDKISMHWMTGVVTITTENNSVFTLVWEGIIQNELMLYSATKEQVAVIRWEFSDVFDNTDEREYFIETVDHYKEVNDFKILMILSYCFTKGFFKKMWTF